MKLEIELVYQDKKRNRKIKVKVTHSRDPSLFMDRVDRAVEKATGPEDNWKRWNLVRILEE